MGYTVLHGRQQAPRGVALLDIAHGRRALATTEDLALLASMEAAEWVGRSMLVDGNRIAREIRPASATQNPGP